MEKKRLLFLISCKLCRTYAARCRARNIQSVSERLLANTVINIKLQSNLLYFVYVGLMNIRANNHLFSKNSNFCLHRFYCTHSKSICQNSLLPRFTVGLYKFLLLFQQILLSKLHCCQDFMFKLAKNFRLGWARSGKNGSFFLQAIPCP